MTVRTCTLALVAALLVPFSASAKTYPHAKAKVQVDIPDDWNVKTDDDSLFASPKDDSVALIFGVMDAHKLDEALKELDKELGKTFKNIKTEKPEEVDINGLKGVSVDATAKVEGKEVEMGLMVLQTTPGTVLLVMGFAEKGKFKAHEATVVGIFKTLKATK